MESTLKPEKRFAFAGTSDRFANSAMRSDMPVNRQRQKSSLGKFSNGMWFIGQKVVCINDRFPMQILEWASNLPRKGRIYTIRWMGMGPSIYTGERGLGFELEELPNGKFAFFAERFAPLADKLAQACQRNALELTVCHHPVPLPTHRQHCDPAFTNPVMPGERDGSPRLVSSEIDRSRQICSIERVQANHLRAILKSLANALRETETALEEMRADSDPLAVHIFVARRQYRNMPDTKSGKRSEIAARLSWQTACDLGYRGSLAEWERLMGAKGKR